MHPFEQENMDSPKSKSSEEIQELNIMQTPPMSTRRFSSFQSTVCERMSYRVAQSFLLMSS